MEKAAIIVVVLLLVSQFAPTLEQQLSDASWNALKRRLQKNRRFTNSLPLSVRLANVDRLSNLNEFFEEE
uniref:High frequency protein 2 n=1 Tax=Conus litteratus TaxID=89445 RepID=Q2HZ29_CONLT|nr:high frequency protein 2 [Conus litteratus]